MKRNGISFQCFGWMMLLVISKPTIAHSAIFNDLLESVRNIEKILNRVSITERSVCLTNIPHRIIQARPKIQYRSPTRDVDVASNADVFREVLKLERLKPFSKGVGKYNRRANDRVPKIYDKSLSLEEDSDENINSNSNSNNNRNDNSNDNTNVNSNSNINAMKYGRRHPKSGLKTKTGENIYGGRSLSQAHVKDTNRNVNSNTNVNTNTNSDVKNTSADDNDDDDDNDDNENDDVSDDK